MIEQISSNENELIDEREITSLEIGIYDVHLPCRQYRINFKVAELGKVSLTTEFLLRLIHAVDGMYETDVAQFFDFSAPEMTYLLNESVSLGYIIRESGQLWLTHAGKDLFVQDSNYPQIFNVEDNTLDCGFDLIAFAYQDKNRYEIFDSDVYELAIDPTVASKGTKQVFNSFKNNFREITSQYRLNSELNKSLYSIDNVSPGNRFTTVIPITVKVQKSSPSRGEPDLSKWRTEDELEQRQQIMPAIAKFMDGLHISLPRNAKEQYKFLHTLAPDLMEDYLTSDGISVHRFYKETVALKRGGFRKNRKTIPIAGSLFNMKNVEILLKAISHVITDAAEESIPNTLYWLAPNNWQWGRTHVLPELLKKIFELLSSKLDDDTQKISTTLLRNCKFRAPDKVFGKVEQFEHNELPRNLEIFLIPGICVTALVHLPVNSSYGHAVPLGFISIDPSVISNAEKQLKAIASIDVPVLRSSRGE